MPDKNLSGICGYELFAKFMQPKISAKRTIFIAAFLGLVLLAAVILSFGPKNSSQSNSALPVENIALLSNQEPASIGLPASPVGLPARLKIPIIQVDSVVIPVGLTSDGAMDVPKGPNEVAWFNLRSRPGENGTAVIAGHYGWKNNLPAVFDNLRKLSISDKISVEDEKGSIITFVVREIRTYGKDESAPDVFGSNDGKAHLNLVTCAGVWNQAEKIRSERLVVFTDKE